MSKQKSFKLTMPGRFKLFTTDLFDREIYFSEKWYKYHIKENHPAVSEEIIKDTLKNPTKIYGRRSKIYIKKTNKGTFKVVVRRFNKILLIITAYKVNSKKIKEKAYNN